MNLDEIRTQIDAVDDELTKLFSKRMELAADVAGEIVDTAELAGCTAVDDVEQHRQNPVVGRFAQYFGMFGRELTENAP